MTSFQIIEHVIPCQHIRDYHHATKNNQEVVLSLAIKQYIPLNNLSPQEGDVTIIAAGSSGMPKEVYEPMWDQILSLSDKNRFRIRGIWIADIASQGASGVLNEYDVGDDPSWADHSRDLLHMINHFRAQMPRPLIGIGHSIGPAQLVYLSAMHPRLLSTLIFIEPVMALEHPPGPSIALPSTFRRDLWPSREPAEKSFRESSFFKNWDRETLQLYTKYGLRPLPTALYPSISQALETSQHTQETYQDTTHLQAPPPNSRPTTTLPPTPTPVTLTTSKHQAAWTTLRSNFHPYPSPVDPLLSADLHPSPLTHYTFHRPCAITAFLSLPTLRPSVLYIFGSVSNTSTPASIAEKMRTTGMGMGGSGGVRGGKVEGVVVRGRGHFLVMERGGGEVVAEKWAEWIGRKMREEREVDGWWRGYEGGRSEGGEGWRVSARWEREVRGRADKKRVGAGRGWWGRAKL